MDDEPVAGLLGAAGGRPRRAPAPAYRRLLPPLPQSDRLAEIAARVAAWLGS